LKVFKNGFFASFFFRFGSWKKEVGGIFVPTRRICLFFIPKTWD